MLVASAVLIAAAIIWAGSRVARELSARRDARASIAQLLAVFAPGVAAASADPRALLTWQPLAATARQIFPDEFAALDKAAGGAFPFSDEQIHAAHARWTADWLAWERSHDAEYKLKALLVEQELGDTLASAGGRARIDAIERDKLDQYQRRYEEYTRIARGLQALVSKP